MLQYQYHTTQYVIAISSINMQFIDLFRPNGSKLQLQIIVKLQIITITCCNDNGCHKHQIFKSKSIPDDLPNIL
jgi:hypothetical protein